MRKPTLFISAALTAFMLAVLFGVVSAYQNVTGSTEHQTAQNTQPAPVVQIAQPSTNDPAQIQNQIPTQAPAPTQPVSITGEEAANIASKVLGRSDLYSVELKQLNGVDAYLVTFSSGDLVYVGLDGQILSISKLPVTVVTSGGGHHGGGNKGGGGTTGGGAEPVESGGDN